MFVNNKIGIRNSLLKIISSAYIHPKQVIFRRVYLLVFLSLFTTPKGLHKKNHKENPQHRRQKHSSDETQSYIYKKHR